MKKILLSSLLLTSVYLVAQPSIQLVKQFSSYNTYSNMIVLNNMLIMQGKTSAEGAELWTSNGTTAGTNLLVDLVPGSSSSSPRFFKNALGKVLFVGYGAGFVNQLYMTDGTAAGTSTLCALSSFASLPSIALGKEVNGNYYFVNNSAANGDELWMTDGTVTGTQLVKDINVGANSSSPANFESIGNILYFTANDGINGIELWQSDGTAGGTTIVKDIVTGSSNSNITEIKNYNNKLYFAAGSDVELWQSDGTNAGTILLKDISTGISSSPNSFINFNGKLYFSAEGNAVVRELYETDGTTIGTVLTKDINVGTASGLPSNFYPVNNKLYMTAVTAATGRELMVYDPLLNTVSTAKDVTAGTGNGVSAVFYPNNGLGITPHKIAHTNNTVAFAASESGFSDTQIWLTDGTPTGSSKILYSATTYTQASQYFLTTYNNEIYFYSDYLGTNSMSLYKLAGFTVNLNENKKETVDFVVYPNPSHGVLNIQLNNEYKNIEIYITNILGEIVLTSSIDKDFSTINTNSLQRGVYFILVKHEGKQSTQKIIIE